MLCDAAKAKMSPYASSPCRRNNSKNEAKSVGKINDAATREFTQQAGYCLKN